MVYFVQINERGPIKIGYSRDVRQRVIQLASHYGCRVTLVGTTEGGREREAELHARFAHLRLGGTEQFRPSPELLDFIGARGVSGDDSEHCLPIPVRDSKVFLTIKVDPELRKDLRIAAIVDGMHLKDWLPEFLRRHLPRGDADAAARTG